MKMTTRADLQQLAAARDWAGLRAYTLQHPHEAIGQFRRQGVLAVTSPLHLPQVLMLYGDLAFGLGYRDECGWALYQAGVLVGDVSLMPPPLQRLLLRTHPVWSQPVHGPRLTLFRPQQRHFAFLRRAFGDQAFVRKYNAFLGPAESAAQGYLDRAQRPMEKLGQLDWVIETKAGEPIGLIGLAELIFQHRRGELLVGFPGAAGSARIALEANLLVLSVAFRELRLNKLVSYVYADNPKAQQVVLNLGFSSHGLLQRHVVVAGHPEGLDVHADGLLREDYFANPRLKAHCARALPGVNLDRLFNLPQSVAEMDCPSPTWMQQQDDCERAAASAQ